MRDDRLECDVLHELAATADLAGDSQTAATARRRIEALRGTVAASDVQ